MKFCGHTMGTPEMDVFEAIDFFAWAGFEGIELRCWSDGVLDLEPGNASPNRYTARLGARIVSYARERGLELACLTPYHADYASPARCQRTLEGMRRALEIAHNLGIARVRAYGGAYPQLDPSGSYPAGVGLPDAWERTVSGLRELGDAAGALGITLCVEIHKGTLTETADDALRMMSLVDMSSVRVIYQMSHITQTPADVDREIKLLAPYIHHVHFSAHPYLREGRAGLADALLSALVQIGYDGYVSDEYGKYWHPEWPGPEEAMVEGLKYLKRRLAEVRK